MTRAALNKLVSTKFPASAVLMELACHAKRMSTKAIVEWAPRDAKGITYRLDHNDEYLLTQGHSGGSTCNGESGRARHGESKGCGCSAITSAQEQAAEARRKDALHRPVVRAE